MRRPGSFERRLLVALVAFSLIPTLLLVGVGSLIFREAVSLQTTPAGWERLGESGRELLDLVDRSGDEALVEAAARHRNELSSSIQQAQRWGYLNRRLLVVIPWLAIGFVAALGVLAVRSARRIARDLSLPIGELVGWAGRVGRGEPLPEAFETREEQSPEFGVLQDSFRAMAAELERSRAREIESERMKAAVGVARGVAHELKNVVTPLRFAVRTLAGTHSSEPARRDAIHVIDAESHRLEALARAFAQLGQPPEGPMSEVDMVELVEYLIRANVPDRITVATAFEEGIPHVVGHYDPLSRAFGNLLHNAVEAIGEGPGNIGITVARANGGVEVRIVDSGSGLLPEAESRIWEPDFTTKSSGTGLGLALVRQTVLAHGGEVWARNAAGGGAEVGVLLPLPDSSPG